MDRLPNQLCKGEPRDISFHGGVLPRILLSLYYRPCQELCQPHLPHLLRLLAPYTLPLYTLPPRRHYTHCRVKGNERYRELELE